MTGHWAALITSLALLSGGAALWAQDGDTSAAVPAGTEQPAEQPAKNAPQRPPLNTSTPPSDNDESPFDYKSSEEISEDLSVSFPVDI